MKNYRFDSRYAKRGALKMTEVIGERPVGFLFR